MMQEVTCDDTNGESTFEFVEGKLEGLVLSDDVLPSQTTSTTSFPPPNVSDDAHTLEPTAPPTAESVMTAPSIPAPTALPQFIHFPIGYTTTTSSVQTPLSSTIPPNQSPIQQFSSIGPVLEPPLYQQALPPPPVKKDENIQTNPYSLSAQRKKPSYPPATQNIATPLPVQTPTVVQSQPTAFYPTTEQASTAINVAYGSYDMGAAQSQQHYQTTNYPGDGENRSLFSWFREMPGGEFISKVAEKAKNSMDTMITTLDPQMKEYIHSGGDIDLYVASNDEETVSAIREAFQTVFGRATVRGINSQNPFAPQLVGFSAGMQAADERIQHLRKTLVVDQHQALVAVDHFIAELTPDRWFDLACLVLHDPLRAIQLHVYSQPTPVPNVAIQRMQEQTPTDFSMRWSGLCITVGSVLSQMYQVPYTEWHQLMSGVSKKRITVLAANTLATQYKLELFNKS